MTFEVDEGAIEAWVREFQRHHESPKAGIWVVIPALDRHERAREVTAALGPRPHTIHEPSGKTLWGWTVYPTDEGTCLWVSDGDAWRPLVEEMVAELDARGHSGTVTASPGVSFVDVPRRDVPTPAALLGLRIEPDFEHLPLNVWGRPQSSWGVPEDVTEHLLRDAIAWVTAVGGSGLVHASGPPITVGPVDAFDVTAQQLTEGWHDVQCTFLSGAGEGSTGRAVRLSSYGQVSFAELGNEPGDEVRRAEELAELLTRHAPLLDFGAVAIVRPGSLQQQLGVHVGPWMLNRHLWSSRAPQALGIQLLTSAHLENAHDLSTWHTAEVAPDRYLVQASDLAAWFAPPDATTWARGGFPSEDTLTRAQTDFGDLVLTDAVASANAPRFSHG